MHCTAVVASVADRTHGFLYGVPQPRDFGGRVAGAVVLLGSLPFGERQRQIGAMTDLAAPHRHIELGEAAARTRDGGGLAGLAPRRGAIDDHGIGRRRPPRERDRLLHRDDVEHAGPTGNNDQRGGLDSISDAR